MSDEEWYYTHGDERCGPVSFAGLKELARGGQIDPRHDLVWSRGMVDWIAAGEAEGLFSKRTGPTLVQKDDEAPVMVRVREVSDWRGSPSGTARFGYIMGTVVVPMVVAVLIGVGTPLIMPHLGGGLARNLPLALSLLIPLIFLMTFVSRLKNLGMSGWWVFGLCIPLVNIWLCYRTLACPPDYAYAKKLDAWGWFLGGLYWLISVLALALPLVAITAGDKFPEVKKVWDKILEDAKHNDVSVPWEMQNSPKPATGPVKK